MAPPSSFCHSSAVISQARAGDAGAGQRRLEPVFPFAPGRPPRRLGAALGQAAGLPQHLGPAFFCRARLFPDNEQRLFKRFNPRAI